jgi:tRNA (guanine-N7-)-methyltransferase
MSRTLKWDIPGTDWRVDDETLREVGIDGVFAREGGAKRPLVLEIGFGRGEFLIELAANDPGSDFLGIEISGKRVLKLARRMALTELSNVRLLHGRAERSVADLLPEGSLSQCWINFPDPWPKKRHQRRRLVDPSFIGRLTARIARGGELHLATDHVDYAEAMDAALTAETRLENRFAPDRFRSVVPGRKPTAYELEWRAQGRACHFFTYRRTR